MLMKHSLGVCIATLLVTACGGPVSEEEVAGAAPVSQEQDIIRVPTCKKGDGWIRRYYSDAAKTHEVGRDDCNCNGTFYAFGVRDDYTKDFDLPCY
ncbi:MAG: hypothetical protein EOO71_20855 [Myxococcaceae bacterium]|nr:MAG: hypothetical protein EOO71_20855 [Myxococcaceae bacterium]